MKTVFKSTLFFLALLIGCTFLVIFVTDHYILTFDFYKKSGELGANIIEDQGQLYLRLQKWIYVSSLILLLLKILVITLILNTALYMAEVQVSFANLFRVVILSEFIFLIPAVTKILWFLYHYPDGDITDWYSVNILSMLSVIEVPPDWQYLFQSLSLFEIGYWFLLALGICHVTKLNYDHSLRIVIVSYLPALLIWIAAVTFCSLVYFPSNG